MAKADSRALAQLKQGEFHKEHHIRGRHDDLAFCAVCGPLKAGEREGDPRHLWDSEQWERSVKKGLEKHTNG